MTMLLFLALLCMVALPAYGRLKALWNLEEMSVCRLGYPAIVYNNYGCWCGIGGGGEPMDGIDR